jgi:hypothetical protein
MTRTLVDHRPTHRAPTRASSRRRAEQRARRWVLRELDRLDHRKSAKDDHR